MVLSDGNIVSQLQFRGWIWTNYYTPQGAVTWFCHQVEHLGSTYCTCVWVLIWFCIMGWVMFSVFKGGHFDFRSWWVSTRDSWFEPGRRRDNSRIMSYTVHVMGGGFVIDWRTLSRTLCKACRNRESFVLVLCYSLRLLFVFCAWCQPPLVRINP